jgi:hypothetical protein
MDIVFHSTDGSAGLFFTFVCCTRLLLPELLLLLHGFRMIYSVL